MSRLRSDLALVYKILFGVICVNNETLFTLRNQPQLRGHNYTLTKPRCAGQVRQSFLEMTVVNIGSMEQFSL